MRNILLVVLISLAFTNSLSAAPAQFAFRISFTDKSGAPQLSAASDWLSARSLVRRAHFGISLDSTDRPVSPLYIDTVLQLTDGILHTRSRWLNNCVILVEDSAKMQLLRDKPYISKVEWVGYFANGLHQRMSIESEPAGKTTADSSYYGKAWFQTNFVHGEYLHDRGFKGAGKLIVLLDAGFKGLDTHSGLARLRNEGRLLETFDFCKNDYGFDGNSDHGLGSLSLISGFDSGQYVGSAPEAEIAVYVTEDNNFSDSKYEIDNLIAGMERADSIGADVVSVSLGYWGFGSPVVFDSIRRADMDGHSTNEARAVNLAVSKGIFYVQSAGNGGDFYGIVSPGDADSALTIGSVDENKKLAFRSSLNLTPTGRMKPELCFLGQSPYCFLYPGKTAKASGTSVATPQAAGYAACLLQAFPDKSLFQIRNAMIESADSFQTPTIGRGFGIPDFRKVFSTLDVENHLIENQLNVSPNPFGRNLTVTLPERATVANCALFDIGGRRIPVLLKRSANELRIEIRNNLPAGVYVLKAEINGVSKSIRVVHE